VTTGLQAQRRFRTKHQRNGWAGRISQPTRSVHRNAGSSKKREASQWVGLKGVTRCWLLSASMCSWQCKR